MEAIDAGNLPALERILEEHPALVKERLLHPGAWLRDQVGPALDGFFKQPYLLWFVAEDPVRRGKLPANITDIARAIILRAQSEKAESFQEQLDYALRLVSWSWIARDCGVQIALIDGLADAGAALDGNPDNALVNRNFAAAEHLVQRGARLTLASALCLGKWDDASRLAEAASSGEKQFALVLAALTGQSRAVRRLIELGADVNRPSEELYSHATPLHHAVCSGVLESVQALVQAGASLTAKDTAWQGTPLGWAEHYVSDKKSEAEKQRYAEIARCLRDAAGKSG